MVNKHGVLKRITAVILFLMLLTSFAIPFTVKVQASKHKVVRVG